MARTIASRLGYEADLEGGITDGRIHLFQARPITTPVNAASTTASLPSTQTERAGVVHP